jgi:hypothetical protein
MSVAPMRWMMAINASLPGTLRRRHGKSERSATATRPLGVWICSTRAARCAREIDDYARSAPTGFARSLDRKLSMKHQGLDDERREWSRRHREHRMPLGGSSRGMSRPEFQHRLIERSRGR